MKMMELLIVVVILGILAAIVIPILRTPDVNVYIGETDGKKTLVYQVEERYAHKRLYFRDIGLDGALDRVEGSDGYISEPTEPNMVTPTSEVLSASWNIWVDRFEQEIRPEAVGN